MADDINSCLFKGDQAKAPVTFNFTPLTKPTEEKEKSKSEDVENKNPFQEKKEDPKPAEKFVFGQNLTERVENVDSKAEDDKNEEASGETETAANESANTESSKNSDLLFSNSVNPSTKSDEDSSKTTGKTLRHEPFMMIEYFQSWIDFKWT